MDTTCQVALVRLSLRKTMLTVQQLVHDPVLRTSFAANGSSSFTVGTVANVSGKSYYVSKVTVKVTTAFVGADELLLSDGTNSLVGTDDVDLSEGGIYMIDPGYENATTGGATLTASIRKWWIISVIHNR